MGDRYYYDEEGERRTLHRDMLQMQREARKTQAKSQRDAYRDKIQKAKDDLFNGQKREISTSTTRDNKQENGARDGVKIHKKDQKMNTSSTVANSGGDSYNDAELRARIQTLEDRLNEATIDAECSASGVVIVTLNI